jgi:SH3-like domain-containing protein
MQTERQGLLLTVVIVAPIKHMSGSKNGEGVLNYLSTGSVNSLTDCSIGWCHAHTSNAAVM